MHPSRSLFQHLYKAKRPWPPDFTLLTPKHQFSLERRYRRRSKLKWARPRLHRAVKITQWAGGIFAVAYTVLWADWGETPHPFGPIREWVSDVKRSFWTTASPPRPEFSARPRDDQASPSSPSSPSSS